MAIHQCLVTYAAPLTQDAVWLSLYQPKDPGSNPGHYMLAMLLTLVMLALSALAGCVAMLTHISAYIGACLHEWVLETMHLTLVMRDTSTVETPMGLSGSLHVLVVMLELLTPAA
eukprot:1059099-Pelagomonas_calceolata.AAC.1